MITLTRESTVDAKVWLAPAFCAVAAVLWVLFASPVDPGGLGSFGLIGALHPLVLLALVLLSVGFVLELRADTPRTWLLVVACVLGVLCMYGLPPMVEPVARLPVAWLHVGWADYIAQHGEVLPRFDARFSWPAFFAFAAWLADVSGTGDASVFLAWAPPVFTGLAAIGVHAVAKAITQSKTAPWLATWLFLCVNWLEQDYFSPQAMAYLLYLAALVIVVRFLWREKPERVVPATFALTFVILALAPTHQVTPFALAGLLVLLTITRRIASPWLCVVAVLTPITWLVLGASDYWTGHLGVLTGGVGDLSSAVQENVGHRVVGDTGRMSVLGIRFGLIGLVIALAIAGWWRMGRPVVLGIAAVLPFGLVALQSYGGEMLLRSHLYALPLLCALSGVALSHWIRHPIPIAVALGITSIALVTARGGNDAYVAFRKDDVTVVREAYRITEPGQRIAALTAYAPLHWSKVGQVRQLSLERVCRPDPAAASCVRRIAPDVVVITKAQDNYGVIMLGLPVGWTRSVTADLVRTGGYHEHLRIGDTVVLVHGGSR